MDENGFVMLFLSTLAKYKAGLLDVISGQDHLVDPIKKLRQIPPIRNWRQLRLIRGRVSTGG